VSNAIKEYLSAALNEIWSSIKNGLISLYRVIIVIDLFLWKTLAKVAKI